MFDKGDPVAAPDGKSMDTYWLRAKGERRGLVVFFMDGFGPRPSLETIAQHFADWGYDVVVPDLYYRDEGSLPVDVAAVFSGGDYATSFFTRINAWTEEMVVEDVEAIASHVGSLVEDGEKLAAVGYCLGGRYALTFAGLVPKCSFAASVHGAGLATDSDKSAHLFAGASKAEIHVSVAGIDPTFTPEELEKLRENLEASGKHPSIHTHEGAVHGFSFSDLPVFNEAAREKHIELLAGFLKEGGEGG